MILNRGLALALGVGVISASGCYDNVATDIPDGAVPPGVDAGPFLPGLEPWEPVNLAPRPAPVGADPCPEVITFQRVDAYMRANAVHARACIHAPLDVVWASIQNPQTGRDPTTTSAFAILPAPIHAPQCDGAAYETHLFVDDIVDVDFYICWRHQLVMGTEAAPIYTASRWGKVFGTSAISRLEGSLVAHPLEADPTVTELEYQYHLNAVSSDHATIERYLGVIYSRLRDDAHGVPLLPADF